MHVLDGELHNVAGLQHFLERVECVQCRCVNGLKFNASKAVRGPGEVGRRGRGGAAPPISSALGVGNMRYGRVLLDYI